MRIKFTNEEVDELIEFIERVCDPCTDEEVEYSRRILAKLKRAVSYSWAGKRKHSSLYFGKIEREREIRMKGFKEGLKARKEITRKDESNQDRMG